MTILFGLMHEAGHRCSSADSSIESRLSDCGNACLVEIKSVVIQRLAGTMNLLCS